MASSCSFLGLIKRAQVREKASVVLRESGSRYCRLVMRGKGEKKICHFVLIVVVLVRRLSVVRSLRQFSPRM